MRDSDAQILSGAMVSQSYGSPMTCSNLNQSTANQNRTSDTYHTIYVIDILQYMRF